MDENKNFFEKIFDKKILIVEWTIIILVCAFIGCTNHAKAATASTVLPYLPNNNFNAASQEEIDNVLANLLLTYPEADFTRIIVFKVGANAWYTWSDNITVPSYIVYSFSDDYCTSNWYGPSGYSTFENFQLFDSDYYVALNLSGVTQYTYIHRTIGDYTNKQIMGEQSFRNVFGSSTMTQVTNSYFNFSYNENYPCYTNFNLDTRDYATDRSTIIALDGGNSDITQGHATQPVNDPNNFINGIDGHPIPKPDTPTITPYTPPQPQFPTIDTSTLETLLESLIDTVLYGFQYLYGILTGFFSNLLSNLLSLFNYLIDSVSYAINKIIKSIQDLATDFYNNMVSLFEPLFQTVDIIKDLLTEFFKPFDQEQFEEAFENCEFINAIQEIDAGIENFKNAFEFAEERDYYTLYLGFMMEGYTVNYDLDFTWLYPLRQYYRPIIWAVVIYELFVFLCSQLSDYLQGRSGK